MLQQYGIMEIAYLDCFSGVSGDMLLGALVDSGVKIDDLRTDLSRLRIPGLDLEASQVQRAGVHATIVKVMDEQGGAVRKLADMEAILDASSLGEDVREGARTALRRLAEIEAGIHGCKPDETHFHELGGVDTIADVVGTLCGFKRLGVDAIHVSPVNVGSGTIKCAHGILPVPAPATAELLRGAPIYSVFEGELTTPTGALLVTQIAHTFGPMPPMRLDRIGHGAGSRETHHPNVLRLFIGASDHACAGDEAISQIETNIDDMNPQLFGAIFGKLADAGALDTYLTSIQMKKNRPGLLLTTICPESTLSAVADVIFRETTTLGMRFSQWNRLKLPRRMRTVETRFGELKVKVAVMHGRIRNAAPEYEECVRLADAAGASIAEVLREAARAASEHFPSGSPDPGDEAAE
jgi:pyridinium-3,5-bisthiocarboxylic acid mononucleotide nickel chelatase